jgi:hypothetical protein
MRHNVACGIRLAVNQADALSLFPHALNTTKRGSQREMRVLRKTLFICAMVAGLSLAAFAQRDDKKPPPKKDPPPVINPGSKNPPPTPQPTPPKKKPGELAAMWRPGHDGQG